jgi:hypothetical protein
MDAHLGVADIISGVDRSLYIYTTSSRLLYKKSMQTHVYSPADYCSAPVVVSEISDYECARMAVHGVLMKVVYM